MILTPMPQMMLQMSLVSRLLEGESVEDKNWQKATLFTMAGVSAYHFGPNMLVN